MDITSKLQSAVKGDDYPPDDNGDHIATAGIHLGQHGNGIEVYGNTIEEAQAMRDEILRRILGANA